MTIPTEIKEKAFGELAKAGVAVVVMAVVIYFQRQDYMEEIKIERDSKSACNEKYQEILLNLLQKNAIIIEKNNEVIDENNKLLSQLSKN